MAGHSDPFHHVRDSVTIDLPQLFGGPVAIPQPFGDAFPLTKFMVLEVVAGLIVLVIFRALAIKVASGEPVRGVFWNFWEAIAVALRDTVVRPTIGVGHDHHGHDEHHEHGQHEHGHDEHAHAAHEAHGHATPATAVASHGSHRVHHEFDEMEPARAPVPATGHPADKYVPYVWSVFFFVLICNLLGAIPWLGSPTGSIWVTAVLALVTLGVTLKSGMEEVGHVDFWKSLVPPMDLPGPMKYLLLPMIWAIEFIGLFIKHGVLAVRLFANIMAGHTVISVMLGFIGLVASSSLFYPVAVASTLGQVGIGMLELFVAFLQAYIFAFLTALFIGTAVHPH